jgi:hypothetical protein
VCEGVGEDGRDYCGLTVAGGGRNTVAGNAARKSGVSVYT